MPLTVRLAPSIAAAARAAGGGGRPPKRIAASAALGVTRIFKFGGTVFVLQRLLAASAAPAHNGSQVEGRLGRDFADVMFLCFFWWGRGGGHPSRSDDAGRLGLVMRRVGPSRHAERHRDGPSRRSRPIRHLLYDPGEDSDSAPPPHPQTCHRPLSPLRRRASAVRGRVVERVRRRMWAHACACARAAGSAGPAPAARANGTARPTDRPA